MSLLHKEITNKIIGAFYEVYNELGHGFLEAVYQSALCLVLQKQGLLVEPQREIEVTFQSQIIGRYKAGIVVERKVIIELKAVRRLLPRHEAQVINFLKATNMEVGLLLNFGYEPNFKRLVFSNEHNKPREIERHQQESMLSDS